MRNKYYFLIIVAILSLMGGCTKRPETYPFLKQDDKIECVELLYYPHQEGTYSLEVFSSIRELSSEEIPTFMDALYALETIRCAFPPAGNYGSYVACVEYTNGDRELFSSGHIAFVKNGEKATGVGSYIFDPAGSFDELWLQYAGEIVGPEGFQ